MKYVIYFCIALLSFNSCMKDKGSYDMSEGLPLVEVDIKRVNIKLGEPIKINPEFSFLNGASSNLEDYEFTWYFNSLLGYYSTRTLMSTRPYVDTVLSRVSIPAEWYFSLLIKHKKTNYLQTFEGIINVTVPGDQGYLLLVDLDEKDFRLDMVEENAGNYNLAIDVPKLQDTLHKFNHIPFKATGLIGSNSSITPHNGTFGLTVLGEQYSFNTNKFFDYKPEWRLYSRFDKPEDFENAQEVYGFVEGYYGGWLWADGNFHKIYNGSYYSNCNVTVDNPTPFKTSRYISGLEGEYIVFNEDNKTFYKSSFSSKFCVELPEGKIFNFKTGLNLMYMNFSGYNSEILNIALLKDSVPNTFRVAVMNMNGAQRRLVEFTSNTLAEAKIFAISNNGPVFFYATEHKLYSYDFEKKEETLIEDFGTKAVTFLQTERIYDGSLFYPELVEKTESQLTVAVYDPLKGATGGTVIFYDQRGNIQNPKRGLEFNGTGKVKAIKYVYKY